MFKNKLEDVLQKLKKENEVTFVVSIDNKDIDIFSISEEKYGIGSVVIKVGFNSHTNNHTEISKAFNFIFGDISDKEEFKCNLFSNNKGFKTWMYDEHADKMDAIGFFLNLKYVDRDWSIIKILN